MSRAAWAIGAAVVAAELLFGPRYGLFRDELYYLACADHLSFGYVDHPPLSIAVLALVRAVLGESLLAIRVVPALLGGALVVLSARIARVLGGGAAAQLLAALAVAVAPVYLGVNGFYSMNGIDQVAWAAAELLIARLLAGGDPRRGWLALGVVLGLGLENKLSVLFLGAGLAVALVATPLRRHLARPWPWLALLVAAALFAPHAIWQAQHGFPTREFIANATRYKNVALSPLDFALAQAMDLGPINLLVWLPGLVWLLASPRFRALGIIYVAAFAILVVQHSKPYYLAPAYPALFAAGGVALERLPRALRAAAGVLVAAGAAAAPLAIPVLPVAGYLRYAAALGQKPRAEEHSQLGPLPQHFADRFGWQELAATVAQVYWSLPPEDRARVVIVADNYGEAAAIDHYGRRYGLPRASSQHNSYYLWGPGRDRADVAILVGEDIDGVRGAFREVREAARVVAPYAMPYETARPILVARDLKLPLDEAWRLGRHFI